jgi:pyridoxine kinase
MGKKTANWLFFLFSLFAIMEEKVQGCEKMKQVLTIAGLDSLAGGGATADIKTFEEFQTFGHMVLTCIAAINEEITIHDIPAHTIVDQLASIATYIELAAIKIGLLQSIETIEFVKDFLDNQACPVVLDPVLVFKEGQTEEVQDYQEALLSLFPLATLVTPNLVEAEYLAKQPITTRDEMKIAAQQIKLLGPEFVLIKGGARLGGNACDLLYDGENFTFFEAPKLASNTTNGAGCTLSAAIAALLAKNTPMIAAVQLAKDFVFAGIEEGIPLTNAMGNVNQLAYFEKGR